MPSSSPVHVSAAGQAHSTPLNGDVHPPKPVSVALARGRQTVRVVRARVHNLKNLSVEIPRNALVVVTGVSGSGKSSLVFDTLYAEGHRRYVESLSAYARQFLSRLQKPDVDLIEGLSPAIAIEQRVIASNPRSTVGSATEVIDYMRLLFARVGTTYSPISGEAVTCDTVTDVVDYLCAQPSGTRAVLTSALTLEGRSLLQELEVTLQKGFTRLWDGAQARDIEDLLSSDSTPTPSANEAPATPPSKAKKPAKTSVPAPSKSDNLSLLVDRFVIDTPDDDVRHRLADSVQTAFNEGHGRLSVTLLDAEGHPTNVRQFSELFERDGLTFEKPTVALFNTNNSFGACPTCEGFGRTIGLDESLIVPDPNLSLYEGAVAPWRGPTLSAYQKAFVSWAGRNDWPVHRPYHELSPEQRRILWEGVDAPAGLQGIHSFFADVEAQSHKVQYRVLAARYRGYTTCPTCHGTRLRPDAMYVRVSGHTIAELTDRPISELLPIIDGLQLTPAERQTATRLLLEIHSRLYYLDQVGLGYLTLSRKMNTLSGGETQRINLATALGSNLTGSLYILDEPSIGLHPRDGDRLTDILLRLRSLGNTVIVVEHDEGIMRRADWIIDIGPRAGEHGGEVMFTGRFDDLVNPSPASAFESLTADYLTGRRQVPLPTVRRPATGWLYLRDAREHSLRHLDVAFPLGVLTVVTGVSGSGKSTLVKGILAPALRQALGLPGADRPGAHRALEGDLKLVDYVEMVDQNALGKNQRSNPVTYVGAYDAIRELYSSLPAAKDRQLKPLHFSFNVVGGRCETCQGEGVVTVPMQFLPDIKLECETCHGKRFKQVVLEVAYGGVSVQGQEQAAHKGKNIHEVLQLTVESALEFFADKPKIASRLQKLMDVGLGYVRLGQSTATLSGGEAQRLKLASFLDRTDAKHAVYIFDEPTTGLHLHDIALLVGVLQRLVDQGHTVIVIEHHLDVIKSADWLIDLGPEGGSGGGELVYAGLPEGILSEPRSHTARYLAPKLTH